ncbi:hypothetical protein OG21DRAFT_1491815 [Imleria badia]|nr:hypothetical protein OG21DRAFT_1491815 [Imleria badia]
MTSQVATGPPEVPAATGTANEVPDASKPVGPATEGSEPWQLQYYNPPTRDIIECTKQFSHCDTVSINAFPLRPDFNTKATEYIDEAIAKRQAQRLHILDGKLVAASLVRHYQTSMGGSWELALCAQEKGFLFLKYGVNNEGHANNLAHLAPTGLVINFFNAGSTSVGQLFLEVFSVEVPRVAMAIAMTALKVVLDEIASGVGEVNFQVTTYSPVYVEILGLMSKCDTSPIHQVKTQSLHTQWAKLGRYALLSWVLQFCHLV